MADLEQKSKEVMRVATSSQKVIFKDMQSGDERIFFRSLGENEITPKAIDKALQLIVNSVEGDTSQLNNNLAKYAKRKGWLRGFE